MSKGRKKIGTMRVDQKNMWTRVQVHLSNIKEKRELGPSRLDECQGEDVMLNLGANMARVGVGVGMVTWEENI